MTPAPMPTADLSVTKTNGVTLVSAGTTTTYTVVVSNAGPDAANNAIVTDPAATGLTKTTVVCAAAGGATCPASPTVAQVEAGIAIPALPFGGSVTFTIGATVTAAGGNVTNTATVTAPAGVNDPTPANNSASDTDSVGTTVDLSLTMTNGTNSVTAAGSTTYTIVVTNAGTSAAEGAVVAAAPRRGCRGRPSPAPPAVVRCARVGPAVAQFATGLVATDAAARRHRHVHARRHRDGCERHREHHRDPDAARRIHGHEYREQFRDRHRFGHRSADRRPTSSSPRATV